MSDAMATELIHWLKMLVQATEDATQGAERRHQELMVQRAEQFSQDQYSQGLMEAYRLEAGR